MPNYPLRQLVHVECHCCGLLRDMLFASEHDRPICALCMKHRGTDETSVMRRDRVHRQMWRGVAEGIKSDRQRKLDAAAAEAATREAEATAREAEIGELHSEIERLGRLLKQLQQTVREGYALEPPELVKQWLIDEAITFADAELTRVFKSRAKAYRALYDLNELHRHVEGDLEQCVCDQPAAACPELKAIAPMEEILYRWEKKQLELLKKGLDHELPEDHPDVVAARKAAHEAERRRWPRAS